MSLNILSLKFIASFFFTIKYISSLYLFLALVYILTLFTLNNFSNIFSSKTIEDILSIQNSYLSLKTRFLYTVITPFSYDILVIFQSIK